MLIINEKYLSGETIHCLLDDYNIEVPENCKIKNNNNKEYLKKKEELEKHRGEVEWLNVDILIKNLEEQIDYQKWYKYGINVLKKDSMIINEAYKAILLCENNKESITIAFDKLCKVEYIEEGDYLHNLLENKIRIMFGEEKSSKIEKIAEREDECFIWAYIKYWEE